MRVPNISLIVPTKKIFPFFAELTVIIMGLRRLPNGGPGAVIDALIGEVHERRLRWRRAPGTQVSGHRDITVATQRDGWRCGPAPADRRDGAHTGGRGGPGEGCEGTGGVVADVGVAQKHSWAV